ncbi:MAG: hypothetical protein WCJ69_09850 [Betaproteobacteria bacterium]|jgi:hypothetical protein
MTTASVPDTCLGVWRRALLRTPESEDTTSQVFWLQTPRWHADLRIPADRPPLSGARSLAELGRGALLSLASQQGFAGVTTVEGDLCRWHRHVDYQPPSGFEDVGRLEFESGDRLLEYGVQQDYFEIWERLPGSVGPWAALRQGDPPGTWLLRSGDFAMRVRPRAGLLGPASSLAAWCAHLDLDEMRDRLDFEISLARVDACGHWSISHSTLPWLEGSPLEDAAVLSDDGPAAAEAAGWHALG